MVTTSNKHLHEHQPLNTWNNRSFWGGPMTFSIITSLISLSNVIIVIIPSFTHTFLAQSFTRQKLSFPTACWIAFHSIPPPDFIKVQLRKMWTSSVPFLLQSGSPALGCNLKKKLSYKWFCENATNWAKEWGSTASVICRTQGWSGDALADILSVLTSENKPASHSRVLQHTMETKTNSCGCVSLLENGQL